MNAALAVERITKSYGTQTVLHGVDLVLPAGGSALLFGPSGSGKSTLLAILGGMLSPDSGSLSMGGRTVGFDCPVTLTELRRTHLGFIFQHAQLLPFLTVRQNLEVVADNAGVPSGETAHRCEILLDRLGIVDQAAKLPARLSGGQRQRAAIARALIHQPQVLLADEPTAALDWHHGSQVVDLLLEQSHQLGTALLVVTHDLRLVPRFESVLSLTNGRLASSTS